MIISKDKCATKYDRGNTDVSENMMKNERWRKDNVNLLSIYWSLIYTNHHVTCIASVHEEKIATKEEISFLW